MTRHYDNCSAPLCVDCLDKDAIWYPGEKVCTKLPLTELQRKQNRINVEVKKGKFKNLEMACTAPYLNSHSF